MSRKRLFSAINSVIINIDLDTPLAVVETKKEPVVDVPDASSLNPAPPKHIRDIIGDLTLDLD